MSPGYTSPSGHEPTNREMRDACARSLADQMLAGADTWIIESALRVYAEYKEAYEAEIRAALALAPIIADDVVRERGASA